MKFEDNAQEIERACEKIVDDICFELDNYIQEVQDIVFNKNKEMTSAEADSVIMNIPAMLYWVKAEKEKLGIRLDLALKVKEDKWNETYLSAEGTATNKKVEANQATMKESIDCIVFDRAYKMIDNRENMAYELMQSIKKVVSRKMGGIQG